MPVDDHPVHEKTKIGKDFRYGCHNHKPFNKGYYAPDRIYRPDGTFYIVQKFIPFVMSRNCKFDLSRTDPACRDCKWKEDGC